MSGAAQGLVPLRLLNRLSGSTSSRRCEFLTALLVAQWPPARPACRCGRNAATWRRGAHPTRANGVDQAVGQHPALWRSSQGGITAPVPLCLKAAAGEHAKTPAPDEPGRQPIFPGGRGASGCR